VSDFGILLKTGVSSDRIFPYLIRLLKLFMWYCLYLIHPRQKSHSYVKCTISMLLILIDARRRKTQFWSLFNLAPSILNEEYGTVGFDLKLINRRSVIIDTISDICASSSPQGLCDAIEAIYHHGTLSRCQFNHIQYQIQICLIFWTPVTYMECRKSLQPMLIMGRMFSSMKNRLIISKVIVFDLIIFH